MKNITHLISILVLAISFLSFESKANQIIECNDCSVEQTKRLVQQQPVISGFYYILDYQRETFSKYLWIVDYELNINYLNSEALSGEETNLSNLLFSHRRNFSSFIEQRPNFWNDIIAGSSSSYIQSNIGSYAYSAEEPKCADKYSPYDFLTDNKAPVVAFLEARQESAALNGIITTWNKLELSVTVSHPVSPISATMNIPKLDGKTITFPSGGLLKVTVNKAGTAFDVIPGSAVDCDNNPIPMSKDEFRHNWTFGSASNFENFKRYGDSFNVTFVAGSCTPELSKWPTSCKDRADGGMECTYRTSECK